MHLVTGWAAGNVKQMCWELGHIVLVALAAKSRRCLAHFSKWGVMVVVGQDLPEVGTELSSRDRWFGGEVKEFCNGFGVVIVMFLLS